MTETEVMRRATIKFSRPLKLEEAQSLLGQLAMQLGASVNYTVTRTQHNHIVLKPQYEEVPGGDYLDITGSIVVSKPVVLSPFRFLRSEEGPYVVGFEFDMAGRDELREYDSATISLWDNTRKVIEGILS